MPKAGGLEKRYTWRRIEMFFNKEKKKTAFVKAKTAEARKKQKDAIAAYYAKKKEEKTKK